MFASYAETTPFPSPLEVPGSGSPTPRSRRSLRQLFLAILRNDYSGARRALVRTDLTQLWPSSGEAPLVVAIRNHRPSLVKLVGSRIQGLLGEQGYPAFSEALVCLLEGWPRQASQAALDHACLEALLACVPLPQLPSAEQGWMEMALPSDNPQLMETLHLEGMPLVDEEGNTLLHLSIRQGAEALVDWCLSGHPTMIQAKNQQGETPLHIAIECGNLSVARRLLEAGADPDVPNARDCTPLALAVGLGTAGKEWSANVKSTKLAKFFQAPVSPSPAPTRL